MRLPIRSIVVLVLLWLEYVLYKQAELLRSMEDVDGTKVVCVFLAIVIVGIVIGVLVAITVVPAIGESAGSFFFNPGEEIKKDPHADAMAKIAQGDYEGAIDEYKKTIENNPDDTHAVSEVVHLYCDKLADPDSAEKMLEDALQKEWPPDQSAFLASRLVDVYWDYKHDAASARHILQQIAETMPETKHAANAYHRLHVIDRALADKEAGINPEPDPTSAPPLGEAE